jgi:hypothetical protein
MLTGERISRHLDDRIGAAAIRGKRFLCVPKRVGTRPNPVADP